VTTHRRGSRSFNMDYATPSDVVASMVDASVKRLALAPRDLLIRGALSGALCTTFKPAREPAPASVAIQAAAE
jgi:hypothetical protein